MCHINFHPTSNKGHQDVFDYLANMTPHSTLHNETVQRLRRITREVVHGTNHLNEDATERQHNDQGGQSHHNNKINTETHWRFVKNKIRQRIKFIDSHNQPPAHGGMSSSGQLSSIHADNSATNKPNCRRVNNYAWLFILCYILFALSLFTFLVLSESTVFTITIITAALPLIGIFWSMWELETEGDAGKVET